MFNAKSYTRFESNASFFFGDFEAAIRSFLIFFTPDHPAKNQIKKLVAFIKSGDIIASVQITGMPETAL